ncbi:MAG: fibronectin type III domain-containing protein [Ruminococcus sp.]|nr:fibronectin type III domain-containing protein [Ruminococcus sp.]
MKKSVSILLAIVMLLSVIAVSPITASAYDYEKPQNFRVTGFTDSTISVAWSPRAGNRPSYQFVWGTSPEPDWRDNEEWWSVSKKTEGDYTDTITDITEHHTLYLFVRWVAMESTKSEQRVDGGRAGAGLPSLVVKSDYAMIKFDWKMPDTSSDSGSKSVSVKASAKSVKASALKKSDKTIKPLTIKNAKSVKVTKVKKGTSKKIYKKIKVARKTGAITFKKGKYKKGTYKIKLKIVCGKKSFNKTVKVKIK